MFGMEFVQLLGKFDGAATEPFATRLCAASFPLVILAPILLAGAEIVFCVWKYRGDLRYIRGFEFGGKIM